jgi:hypothetical protein
MRDKIKVKISSFVANILENDALRFGFIKKSNICKHSKGEKSVMGIVELTQLTLLKVVENSV